jgi:hypothetical protein
MNEISNRNLDASMQSPLEDIEANSYIVTGRTTPCTVEADHVVYRN